jgi:hypothetical protein
MATSYSQILSRYAISSACISLALRSLVNIISLRDCFETIEKYGESDGSWVMWSLAAKQHLLRR